MMAVKKDRDGRRFVEAEVEVPGSPEEVWRAIATGRGISSWFVPTHVEEREGGTVVTSFGPGMDAVATITQWDPPRRYSAESEDAGETAEAPGAVATEWIVEARGGGTCIVRVVHRWFADTDDWDGQFEGHAYGWATSFFRFLRLYLAHFRGQKCSAFQLSAMGSEPAPDTWRTIRAALNIDEDTGRFASASGSPELTGVKEQAEVTDPELLRIRATSPQIVAALEGMEGEEPELFLRLERPAPGLAHVMVMPMGGPTLVSMRFHLYGEDGAAAATDAERAWSGWLADRFPQVVSQ
jgi:uncharacterized protein YndB with AHSA1/START domain